MRNKVCDVIFGHFLIIGLLLLTVSIIGWGLALPIPYKDIGVIGSIGITCAVLYAQIGEQNVDMDGGHKR